MPGDNEEVRYSYTGDTSSLRKATEGAMGLLDKFGAKMQGVGRLGSSVSSKFSSSMKGAAGPIAKSMESTSQRVNKSLASIRTKSGTLGTSMAKAKQYLADGFEPVTNKLSRLRGMFDSISPKLQAMKDKTTSTTRSVVASLAMVSAAFRRTESATNEDTDSVNKNSKASKNNADNQKKAADKLTGLQKAYKSLSKVLGTLATSMNTVSGKSRSMTTSLNGTATAANLVSKAFTVMVGIKVGDWFAQSAKQSMNYIENLNLFEVAMGKSVERGKEFVAQMQEAYGMDPSNLMRYAGNFYQLATAIDMPDEAAANLSLTLTKAANDISSLFNVGIEQVFEDLQSGMMGMSRAVRKYGMDIRTTTLETVALSLGITGNVETMSEANRQGLRFIAMLRQANNASGDFARTIESPANQLKILKEQLSQFGRSIGDFFITPIGRALAYINGFIMALRTVLNFISDLLGVNKQVSSSIDLGADSAEAGATAIGGVGDAAGSAAKEIKKLLGPMDELNILQEDTASSGGSGSDIGGVSSEIMDPKIAEAIAGMQAKLEEFEMKANQVRDSILEFLGFDYTIEGKLTWDSEELRKNLIDKFPEWTKTINATFDNWTEIVEAFKNVFNSMGTVFGLVGDKLKRFFLIFVNDDTVSTFINDLADNLNRLSDWIDQHAEGLANFVIILGSMWAAFKLFKGITTLITPVVEFIGIAIGALAPFATLITTIGLVVAAIAILYKNSEDFAGAFDTFVGTFIEGLGTIFTGGLTALQRVWESMKRLWDQHLQPMVDSLGDLLGAVLGTIGSLWSNVSNILSGVFDLMADVWEGSLEPALGSFIDVLKTLMDVLTELWEETFDPILTALGDLFEQIWFDVISPVIEELLRGLSNLGDGFNNFLNDKLIPFVGYIVNTLGPVISEVFTGVLGVISGLITSLGGLIDFIIGVFTGDWERAWKGVQNVFIGIANALISVFETCVNFIISMVNSMIKGIVTAVVSFVNSIIDTIDPILDFIHINIDAAVDIAPFKIPELKMPRIQAAMATGGVVTGPTQALIGEGSYDEAVIPLGDSPQIKELVAEIADAVKGGSSSEEVIDLTVKLDGQVIYKNQEKIKRERGHDFDQGGFQR